MKRLFAIVILCGFLIPCAYGAEFFIPCGWRSMSGYVEGSCFETANTQEAIALYFDDRHLDDIEGIWLIPESGEEMAIVKKAVARLYMTYEGHSEKHPDYPYVVITTAVGNSKDEIGDEIFLLKASSSPTHYYWRLTPNEFMPDGASGTIILKNHNESIWRASYTKSESYLISNKSHLILRTYPKDTSHQSKNGTGFFVSRDGLIVTNHHVIKAAQESSVTTPSGESFKAEVVSASASADLALLRSPYQTKNFLTFARPSSTRLGDDVFTLGFPATEVLGNEVKYTDGSISSLSGFQNDATFYQISVPLQPGNSGGPLVNQDGNVVGLVTAVAAVAEFYRATGSLSQNVNWAVKGAYASLLLPPTMERNERPKSNPIANAKWSGVFIETE